METAEGLHQVLHLDDVIIIDLGGPYRFDRRRIENVLKLLQNNLWFVDSPDNTLIEEGHPLAALHLIQIGGGGHDGDATLLQHQQHLPELLTTDGIDTRGRFIEEEHTRLMHQGTGEGQLLFHTTRQSTCPTVLETFYL